MSAVINDVGRARPALSEYLAEIFRQTFSFFAFVSVLLYVDWRMTLGCGAIGGEQPEPARGVESDTAGDSNG